MTDVGGDAEVIRASLTDPEQFAVIYDRYCDLLYRYAQRRLGPDVAQDVVAEAFLAAFGRREHYDLARTDARPWLFGILTKLIARHHRAEKAHYRAATRAATGEATAGFADDVVDGVSAQAASRQLAAALARLRAAEREVLLLVAWGDLSYEEVATALNLPVGTVRSRLHRARNKLRPALGGANPARLVEEMT